MSNIAAPPRHRKKALLWVTFLLVIVSLATAGFWVYLVVLGESFDDAKLIHTNNDCATGAYHLKIYQYRNGDGYMELVDPHGKVHDKSSYSNGLELSSFSWEKDCRRVMVPSDNGLIFLRVK